ncbi:hypothetical protein KY290_019586 [Solanum tuberosum]|uniref:Putative plant transposon protein domain-containing protein n=1 Tax=Solanum tuberosum TaxID=4113 RepID=A0ABQ7VI82_SOLTU|nr:hypothetical protein KY290_019586 [Solanum tuberosum]
MVPKAKNVAGSKRSRKGEAFGSSSGREPLQNFGKKAVERCGWEWFECQREAKYMGDKFVNEVARVWLKIVCSVLLPAKHLTEVTRDRVVLVYMLMKGMPINVGVILRQNMMKFRNNLRWRFCYGGLITRFLRAEGIEEETVDMTVAYHPDLTGKLVDMTRIKALDTSHGHVLFAQERQAYDDSVMARMFWMAKLQLRIGGRPVTDAEMETMAERYPLTESASFLCRTGPAFLEPLDDNEATVDKAMDDEEDDVVDEEANALMVFDHGDDEA